MPRLFDKITIAGVGLIGGSLALAAREQGLVGQIVGLGRGAANLRAARDRGIIDAYSLDPCEAARNADLLFLSVPVSAMAAVASACAPALNSGAVITDAGSVKGTVVRDVEAVLASRFPFVGAHPIAGGEQAGAGAARPDLFAGSPCILTPSRGTPPEAVRKVRALWEGVGMNVVEMDVDDHDALLARVSHLPHAIAFALVNTLCRNEEIVTLSGQSLRDMTRIAASPTEVWSDIFIANRQRLKTALDEFSVAFETMRTAIDRGDRAALRALIDSAREAQAKLNKVGG